MQQKDLGVGVLGVDLVQAVDLTMEPLEDIKVAILEMVVVAITQEQMETLVEGVDMGLKITPVEEEVDMAATAAIPVEMGDLVAVTITPAKVAAMAVKVAFPLLDLVVHSGHPPKIKNRVEIKVELELKLTILLMIWMQMTGLTMMSRMIMPTQGAESFQMFPEL